MRKIHFLSFLAFVGGGFLLLSCSKEEDEGLQTQPHDANAMMTLMHGMMTKMEAMPMMGDPDQDFAMMMKMHHQGAIDMANLELKSGDDATMKATAQQIIAAQTAEIAQFDAYLATHPAMDTTGKAMFHMRHEMAMEKMGKANDLRVLTGDTDSDFASLMIDHHQSAIESAQAELALGNENQPKMMAEKIIEDQQKEIDVLQDWLLAHKAY